MAEPGAPRELDAQKILTALANHGIRFVLIGGLAAVAHGYPGITFDVDITPSTDRADLARLAAALKDLDAKLRVPGQEYPIDFPLDEHAFDRFTSMTFRTRYGDLDVVFRPDAPDGAYDFERLASAAEERQAFGVTLLVASLDDIIASKSAAGRPKDLTALPLLHRLRERRRRD